MKYKQKIHYISEKDKVISNKYFPKKIDEKYKYTRNSFIYKILSFITYRIFATPFAFIYFKLIKRIKFYNTQILKECKGGFFIYANHTNLFCDGFCPSLICFPKKPHIIVNPINVSHQFWGKFTKMWGALPLPSNLTATKNFYKSIEQTLKKKNPILIYPEEELWPFYTKVRNFSSASFRYPVRFNKPTFTFTTVYKLKKLGKKPKVEIYVDGPFFPNTKLPAKEAQQQLRDEVFLKLTMRSSLSDYEYVEYIKKGDV